MDVSAAPEAARAALAAALASSGFQRAPVVSRFLRYTVEQALETPGKPISAYAIAVDALERDEDFDPQVDPLVRVTAGRVRRALERFYAQEGAGETLRLDLPSGAYRPCLIDRTPPAVDAPARPASPAPETLVVADASAASPTPLRIGWSLPQIVGALAVAALIIVGAWVAKGTSEEDAFSDETPLALYEPPVTAFDVFPRVSVSVEVTADEPLPDWVTAAEVEASTRTALGMFDEVTLVAVEAAAQADYALDVQLANQGESIRVFGQLARKDRGEVLWTYTNTVDAPEEVTGLSPVEAAGTAIAPVFSPYGVLFADVAADDTPAPHFSCIAHAFQYFDRESPARRLRALECIDALLDEGLAHPTLLALKTFLHLDAYRRGLAAPIDGDDPVRTARATARQAIILAPASARAHQAMLAVQKVARQPEAALHSAQLAQAANPFDLDVMTDVAAYYVMRDDPEKAGPLIAQAEEMLLRTPAWFDAYAVLHGLRTDDPDLAHRAAARLTPERSVLSALALALLAHQDRDAEMRQRAIAAIGRQEPSLLVETVDGLLRRGFAEGLAERVAARLEDARRASSVSARPPLPPGR